MASVKRRVEAQTHFHRVSACVAGSPFLVLSLCYPCFLRWFWKDFGSCSAKFVGLPPITVFSFLLGVKEGRGGGDGGKDLRHSVPLMICLCPSPPSPPQLPSCCSLPPRPSSNFAIEGGKGEGGKGGAPAQVLIYPRPPHEGMNAVPDGV